MTGAVILEELRRGDRTTSELAAVTGASRNAIACAVRDISHGGHRVVNLRRRGGQHDALWHLAYDAAGTEDRACAVSGCTTLLSRTNPTPYCRRHLADAAYVTYLERLSAALDDLLGAGEQLSIL
jgi:hypothetical protein